MANAVEVFKQNMVKGRRLASKIEHLAHHDALTDLPNRVLFHEKLEQASDMPAGVGCWHSTFSISISSRQ
jgi:GGDEF domain-containing protein